MTLPNATAGARRAFLLLALFVLAALMAASCGSGEAESPGDGSLGACSTGREETAYCQEVLVYRGAPGGWTLESACVAQGGRYSATCPTARRVGRCTVDNGVSRQVLNYYLPLSAEGVRFLCDGVHGVFEAG